MLIEKNTSGTGDRFAHQGCAQLPARVQARASGLSVHPLWNKSHREHRLVGSPPADVRAQTDAAVAALGGRGEEFVRARRHDPACAEYDPSLRQPLHAGFKVAAKMGARSTDALQAPQATIAPLVTANLLHRHLLPLFG